MASIMSLAQREAILIQECPLWSLRSVRFQMVLLIGCAMTVFGMMRGSLSMAIIYMVKQMPTDDLNTNTTETTTLLLEDEDIFLLDWSVEEQARIHTAYYIGALIAVFTAGAAARRFGAKRVLSFGLFLNVLGSLLTPPVAIFCRHYIFIAILRSIMGFGSGFVIPCGSVIITKWFPIAEKSTAMAIFTTGNQVGIAVSMLITAKICQISFIGGWPIAFLLYGSLGLCFLVAWELLATDKPRDSKYITATELEYIMGKRARKRALTVVAPTPYTKILFSPCVISICMCSFAQSFVLVGLITYLPRYNQLAMQMSINANGIWSAIPFFVQMITKLLFGTVADSIKKKKVSATLVTKVCNGIASFGTAFCILIISLLSAEYSLIVMLLMCTSMGLFSGYVPGYNTSIVSVAPQFTAFISSYSQIYSQAASTLAPFLLGIMTKQGTVAEWRWVFYLLAAVLIISGLVFQFIGHGHSERWGDVASAKSSFSGHLSSQSLAASEQGRSICLDEINARLLRETSQPMPRRSPKVSYRDEDFSIPSRMDELENDCIVEEEDEDPISTSSSPSI